MQMNKDVSTDCLRKQLTVKKKIIIIELVKKTRSLKTEKEKRQTEL